MKTVESRNAAGTINRANTPFFSKERDQHFFGSTQSKKPFFPSHTRPASSIQAKLNIGQPNDQYEREADSVADQVLQHSEDPAALRRGSFSPASVMPFFQQKSASQEEEKVQKLEEEKDPDTEVKKLQRKPIFESNSEPPEDETTVQKKADQSASQTANPAVETSLNSSKGSGHPLPENTRNKMESSMGADFSDVRIHDDSDTARMSKDMNAQAFTHGKDIYFNSGKYDTATKEGKHLLAHELTHTIQQGTELHTSRIQRAGPNPQAGSGSTGSPPPGPPYKINNDELDPSANPKTLKIEKISLPGFKKRNSDKFKLPLVSLVDRPPDTKQDPTWRNAVKGAVNAKVADFLTKIQKPNGSDVYFLKAKESEFRIFGKLKQLQEEAYVPKWNRFGKGNNHEVDHVVEMQLGGADQTDNYELLDATANNSAGPRILGERGRRVRASLEAFTNAGVPSVPNPKVIPADYIISFTRIDNWNLDYSGDGKIYWTKKEIEDGKQLFQLRGMTAEEIAKSQGTQNELVLYVNEHSGSPLRIKLPFAGTINNWLPGIDLVSLIHNTTAADDANFGTIGVQLRQDFSKNLKSNAAFNISFNKTPGLLNTGYMKFTKDQQALSGLLRFVGLSPLIIEEFRLDEKKGIVINGKIKTDLPLFKGAEIDLSVNGKDIRLSKTFSLGEVKSFPSPFKVTDISLSIFASTEAGFGVDGNIDFEVKNLGKGSIKGTGATKDGFGLSGDFNVDKKTFDGNVHVGYVKKTNDENGKWSLEGNIGIKEGVIKGVKKASLKASYKEAVFTVDGDGELSIPGIDKIKLHADFAENGDFTFVADVELKKLPGIKSGSAKVTVASKGEDGLKLGLSGKAVPDLPNVPGLSDLELTISYLDGVFELRAKVGYKKGRFEGSIDVGVTNKQVDEKGQPQGEAQEKGDVSVFGYGSLKVDIYKDIKGTVSIRLTPEKDVLIGGKIEANNLKPFGEGFNYDKEILGFPELEFPLAGIPGISVSAFIKGGVHFKFVWLPLVLKELSVDFKETNINELEKASLEIIGSVGSSAHAEVYLFIEAGLAARVAIAKLKGSLGGEAGLGVDAEAGGKVDATWDMDKGLKFKEIEAFLDVTPKAIFRLTGQVSVDLDLWITSVNLYYHQWVLAEKQLDLSGITLKVKFPIRFKETGEVELPTYESMNIVKPDFSGDSGNKILDDAINGDAKKEEQKKKEELRIKIHYDLRSADNKDVTPTEYTEKMMDKYENAPDLQAFVKTTIEDESRKLEYEHFEEQKNIIRKANVPLANKYTLLNMFTMFHAYVTHEDVEAFKAELAKLEEDKKAEAANAAKAGVPQGPDNKPVNDIPGPPDTGTPPLNNSGGPVRKKEMAGRSEQTDKEHLQRNTDIENAEDDFREKICSAKGNGQPLTESIREQMEAGIGADFYNVKIHDDPESHKLSKEINAQAFTQGNDVFFNAGKYDPATKQGQHLLAHELTHVVQQENGNSDRIQKDTASELDDLFNNAIKESNWKKAAEYLNGFNAKDISDRLSTKSKGIIAAIYSGAIGNPAVGPNAQVASFTRWAYLELNFKNELARMQWKDAAMYLNGFNEPDMKKYVSELNITQKANLRNEAIPNNFNAVVKIIDADLEFQSFEKERVAKLENDYNEAVAKSDWKNAAVLLNAYNDQDIIVKLVLLNITSPDSLKSIRSAADNMEENSRVGNFAQSVLLKGSAAEKAVLLAGPFMGDIWAIQFLKGMEISGITGRFGESWDKVKQNLSDIKTGAKFIGGIYLGYDLGIVKDIWDNIAGIVELAWDLIKLNIETYFEPLKLVEEISTVLKALPDLLMRLLNGEEIGYQVGLYLSRNIKKEFIDQTPFDQGLFVGEIMGRITTEIALLFVGVEEVNAVAKGLKATKWGAAVAEAFEATKFGKALIEAKGAGKLVSAAEEIVDAGKIEDALSKMARIEEKTPEITRNMMRLEEKVLAEDVKDTSKIVKSEGAFDAEVKVGDHKYKRNATDCTWCRYSPVPPQCELHFDDEINKPVSDAVKHEPPNKAGETKKAALRPTFIDSERHAIGFAESEYPSDDWEEQVTFLYGKRAKGNPRNSTIPEAYSAKLGLALEVKDYDIAWSYDKFIANIVNQQGGRFMSLPRGTKQLLFVDVRGQGFTDIDGLGLAIKKRLGGQALFDKVHIMSDKGIFVY